MQTVEAGVSELSFDYSRNVGKNYIYLPIDPTERYGLNLNADYGVFFIKNTVDTYTDGHNFKSVAWQYKIGCQPIDALSFWYGHKSEHLLDQYNSPYYINNQIGVTIYLINKGKEQ